MFNCAATTREIPKVSFHFIGRYDLFFKPPTATRHDVTVQQNGMVVEMEGS